MYKMNDFSRKGSYVIVERSNIESISYNRYMINIILLRTWLSQIMIHPNEYREIYFEEKKKDEWHSSYFIFFFSNKYSWIEKGFHQKLRSAERNQIDWKFQIICRIRNILEIRYLSVSTYSVDLVYFLAQLRMDTWMLIYKMILFEDPGLKSFIMDAFNYKQH